MQLGMIKRLRHVVIPFLRWLCCIGGGRDCREQMRPFDALESLCKIYLENFNSMIPATLPLKDFAEFAGCIPIPETRRKNNIIPPSPLLEEWHPQIRGWRNRILGQRGVGDA